MQTETINIGRTSFVIPGGMQRLKVMPEDPPLMQTFGFHTDGAMCLIRVHPTHKKAAMPYGYPYEVVDGIHQCLGEQQGLVEVKSGKTRAGRLYIYSIVKTLMPQDAGGGMGYTLCMDIDYADHAMHLQCDFQEMGVTGARDTLVFELKVREGVVTLGDGPPKGWFEDPYDPGYTRGLPMNRSEAREYDAMFPNHPLSVCRSFVRTIRDGN